MDRVSKFAGRRCVFNVTRRTEEGATNMWSPGTVVDTDTDDPLTWHEITVKYWSPFKGGDGMTTIVMEPQNVMLL